MKYIKSPLNYIGGKHRLLPQLFPLFPDNIDTFVDLFAGGGNIVVNVPARKSVINDVQREVVDLLSFLYTHELDDVLTQLDEVITHYNLSKENREGYLELRADYNAGKRHPIYFYTLIVHSFNNQIRFNRKGEFNISFGKGRSFFNPRLRQRFIDFHGAIKSLNASFSAIDFRKINLQLSEQDFVYCDPPYLISNAAYNENGGWGEQDDRDLFLLLDDLNDKGVRFGLSNVFTHKGEKNRELITWAEKYNVHYLSYDYSNCSYQTNQDGRETTEVFVTNY